MRSAGVLMGVCLVLSPWLSSAQPLDGQRQALEFLGPVRVEVQLVGAASQAGVVGESLALSIERALRGSDVPVRDAADRTERGDPTLRVAVQAIDAAGGYAFLVSVQLVERVVNYRRYIDLIFDGALPTAPTDSVEPLLIAPGIKWEAQALGTTRRENAPRSIPDAVLTYVDRFVDDYHRAN